MALKKGKSSSNLFAVLSIFGVGAYYVSDSTSAIFQNESNGIITPQIKNRTKTKTPKSFIDSLGSRFISPNYDLTFAQWSKTPEGVESYEKWRKSPTGIKALTPYFEQTIDFKKSLERWASEKKRSFREFSDIVNRKRKIKYNTLFQDWISSDDASKVLMDEYIKDPVFKTKSSDWIAKSDTIEDITYYLTKPKAQKDYEAWIDNDDNAKKLEEDWKKTPNYIAKRDEWLRSSNKKITKEQWFDSSLGNEKYQSWKASTNGQKNLLDYWKSTPNYQSSLQAYLLSSPTRRTFAQYRNDESLWLTSYNNYRVSPQGQREIKEAFQTTTTYANARDDWSDEGKDAWIKSDASNAKYHQWRQTASGQNSLKSIWESADDDHFQNAKDKWINEDYVGKTKGDWLDDEGQSDFDAWSLSEQGEKVLIEVWKKWTTTAAPGTTQYFSLYFPYRIYFVQNILEKPIDEGGRGLSFMHTDHGKKAFQDWVKIAANALKLQKEWKKTFDYETKLQTYSLISLLPQERLLPLEQRAARYQGTPKFLEDFTAWYNAKPTPDSALSNGETFFSKDDRAQYYQDALTKWYDNEFYKSFAKVRNNVFWEALNYWKRNALNSGQKSAYNSDEQSQRDYQKWYYDQGENAYPLDDQYNVDLNSWSSTKAKGILAYERSDQSENDWGQILDASYVASEDFNEKLVPFTATNGKGIYHHSDQFSTDYNSWIDPLTRDEANYLADYEGQFSIDFAAFYNEDSKKLSVYQTSNQANQDYLVYLSDFRKESDYLANPYLDDLKLWAKDFEKGKNIFKESDEFKESIKRNEETYKYSLSFPQDTKDYLLTTGTFHWNKYFTHQRLSALYDNWRDTEGVERDKEKFKSDPDSLFLNTLNTWSGNIIKGMEAFEKSTLAKTLFQLAKRR